MKKALFLVSVLIVLIVLISCNPNKHVEDTIYGTWKTTYYSEANGFQISSNLKLSNDSSFTLVTTASIVNPVLCRAYLLGLGTYDPEDIDTQEKLQTALTQELSDVAYGTIVVTDTYVLLFIMNNGVANEVPFVRGDDGNLYGANMTWKKV